MNGQIYSIILYLYLFSFGLSEFCKKIAEGESEGKGGKSSWRFLSQKLPDEEDEEEDKSSSSVFSSTGVKAPSMSSIILNIRACQYLTYSCTFPQA